MSALNHPHGQNPPRPDDRSMPFDTILFESPVLLAGRFRAPVAHPRFRDSGPAWNHVFVFPRTSVEIRHEGAEPFLAGPNVVTFYNRGQVYSRAAVDPDGDRCEWFAFHDGVVVEAVRLFDPSAHERGDRPFPFHFGPGDPQSYWRQRRVAESLAAGHAADRLRVEEEMLAVFVRLLARAFHFRPPANTAFAARRRELAHAAQTLLASRFRETLTLSEIADELGVSSFHLARVFRNATGTTLHAHRNALRLAAALESLDDTTRDLTAIGLDLGYSSHSHFTAAFRARFGLPPSRARQLLRR
jgi:AraC-like DNA-binding protein